MSFVEEKGNLFDVDDSYALAHCVATDFHMGAGIAVEFKKQFGQQIWLKKNCKGLGTTLLLPKDKVGRDVFYLVTKYNSSGKPTYENIEKSIKDMFKQATKLQINKIAMPKIGCGLDGKDWHKVQDLIKKYMPKDFIVHVAFLV